MKCRECRYVEVEEGEDLVPCRGIYPTVTAEGTYWPQVNPEQQACLNFKQKLKPSVRTDKEVLYEYITYRKRGAGNMEKDFAEWGLVRLKSALQELIRDKLIKQEKQGVVTWWSVVSQNKSEKKMESQKEVDSKYHSIINSMQVGKWITYPDLMAKAMYSSERLFDESIDELVKLNIIRRAKQKGVGVLMFILN